MDVWTHRRTLVPDADAVWRLQGWRARWPAVLQAWRRTRREVAHHGFTVEGRRPWGGRVSREEVRLGYLFILGREPESEAAYQAHRGHRTLQALRTALAESPEGLATLSARLDAHRTHGCPADHLDRPAVCHIHIEKTGGTSLYRMLLPHFDPARVTASHGRNIHDMPIVELSRFDLISAHTDYQSSLFIPRRTVRRIAMFRDPVERLISFYRFHRAHPIADRATNVFAALAQECDVHRFFRHPIVRTAPALNNVYFRTFGTSLYQPIDGEEMGREPPDADVATAAARIRSLDGLGLAERSHRSCAAIFTALGLAPPDVVARVHQTDDFAATDRRFGPAPPIEVDARLRDIIVPLVHIDRVLYRVAREEFERRALLAGEGERRMP